MSSINGRQLSTQLTGEWDAGAEAVNPADATVLDDTGQLSVGEYWFTLWLRASADTAVLVQHRNSANTANVVDKNGNPRQFKIPLPANIPIEFTFGNKISVALNERFRVIQSGALTGNVQATIFETKVSG